MRTPVPTSCSTRHSMRRRNERPGLSTRPFQSRLCVALELDADALQNGGNNVAVEGLSTGHQIDPGECRSVAVHVGELLGEIADAVRPGQWRELNRAEDADGPSARVHESAAGVTRDSRADSEHVMAPAAGRVLEGDAPPWGGCSH